MTHNWRESLGRLLGITVPVFGVSWTPPVLERMAARRIIMFLAQRRLLYALAEMEFPEACRTAAEDIRRFCTRELGKVEPDTEVAKALHAMRAACRQFQEATQTPGRRIVRLSDYRHPAEHWVLIRALGAMRSIIGLHVAKLAVAYGLPVEDDLASILPPAQEVGAV